MPAKNVLTKPLNPRTVQIIQIALIAITAFVYGIQVLNDNLLSLFFGPSESPAIFSYLYLSVIFWPQLSGGLHLLTLIISIMRKIPNNALVAMGWVLIGINVITLIAISETSVLIAIHYLPVTGWIYIGIALFEFFYFFRTLFRKKNLGHVA